MPELPEVETIKRDLTRRLAGRYIKAMTIRCAALRAPVPPTLPAKVTQRKVLSIARRAKYLLIEFRHGTMGVHLGMSGTIRSDLPGLAPRKHDHVEWLLADQTLRYHDPRRFGRVFWFDRNEEHPLLANVGLEPLGSDFTGKALLSLCAGRKQPIKQLLMDGSKVAGLGNIYVCETLYRAKINPLRPAGSISAPAATAIVRQARLVLRRAITAGGSSLRDHAYGDGKPGYFQLQHRVYGKADAPCPTCSTPIIRIVLGQRSTFLCPVCQV